MADFGDEAGQQVYDWMFRLAMTRLNRAGLASSERALREASNKLTHALEAARDSLRAPDEAQVTSETMPEWAKLDMAEFQELEDFEAVRTAIDTKLEEEGLAHAFFDEGQKTYLLFRTQDAPEVADASDSLAGHARAAAERAAQEVRREHERSQGQDKDRSNEKDHGHDKSHGKDRDKEPLEERAQRAHAASRALESEHALEHDLERVDKARPERSK